MFSEGLYTEKKVTISAASSAVESKKEDRLPEFDLENPQTYLDIAIGNEGEEGFEKGRVVFELFQKQTPKTAENFRCLCTGEKGEGITYKNNIFHRIIPSFMMQGGDITNQNGTGGKSIYGSKFPDEQVWLPHTHAGLLSMANSGPDTNGSQFFITYKPTSWLDRKHTVYGRVINGMDICRKAEKVKALASEAPSQTIKIVDCGELTGEAKLTAENANYLAAYSRSGDEDFQE